MNPFAKFYNDSIKIIKKDGFVLEGIKADVQSKKIFTDYVSVPFETGDIISRILPNGKEESYKIIDPVFYHEFAGIPAHYQIEVEKTTVMKSPSAININASGNAKVLVSSVDNSIDNSINISFTNDKIFDDLMREADSIPNNQDIVTAISQMKESVNDKKTFAEKYNNFIQSAAAHMTVFAPFIPALTKLLSEA